MDLKLVHTTKNKYVMDIISEGIQLPLYHGNKEHISSEPDKIYFSVVNGHKLNNKSYGQYNFFLNLDWVKNHSHQFSSRIFDFPGVSILKEFLDGCGIKIIENYADVEDVDFFQVDSNDNIPLCGIDSLIVDEDVPYETIVHVREKLPESIQLYFVQNGNMSKV
jgi:hypothetical protein